MSLDFLDLSSHLEKSLEARGGFRQDLEGPGNLVFELTFFSLEGQGVEDRV